MSAVKLGLLGVSRITDRIIQAACGIQNNIVITAATSRTAAHVEEVLRRIPNVYHSTSFEQLIERDDVDAVYISLPNTLHFEWALKAIQKKKHVLIEKPAALSHNALREIDKEAKDHGVFAMEAMWYRYHSQTEFLRKFIRSGELGKLLSVSANYCFISTSPDDIRWNALLGGGAINDLYCYQADLLTHILGLNPSDFSRVEAFARYRNGVPASVFSEIQTYNGATLNLMASIERSSTNLTSIIGERAACIIPDIRVFPEIAKTTIHIIGENNFQKDFSQENAYQNMLNAFIQGISSKRGFSVALDETIANLKLIDMIDNACKLEMSDRTALVPRIASKWIRLRSRFFGR